jgi:predicted dehydrogenase
MDEWVNLTDEPNHQELCMREQQFFLKAIREDLCLAVPTQDAINSLKIAFACDESVRTGEVIKL